MQIVTSGPIENYSSLAKLALSNNTAATKLKKPNPQILQTKNLR